MKKIWGLIFVRCYVINSILSIAVLKSLNESLCARLNSIVYGILAFSTHPFWFITSGFFVCSLYVPFSLADFRVRKFTKISWTTRFWKKISRSFKIAKHYHELSLKFRKIPSISLVLTLVEEKQTRAYHVKINDQIALQLSTIFEIYFFVLC